MYPIIEVAIGLVLVFLVVAVMVSSVTEIISGMLRVRASTLERGITVMLGEKGKDWLYKQSLITTSKPPGKVGFTQWWRWFRSTKGDQKTGGTKDNQGRARAPSYIDAVTFAATLTSALSAPTSETLLAELIPGQETAEKNIRAALSALPDICKAALGLAGDPLDLARYLLDRRRSPNAVLTDGHIAGVVGDWDAAKAVIAGGIDGDPAKAVLQGFLGNDPPPTDTVGLVAKVAAYAPSPLTPRISDVLKSFKGLGLSDEALGSLATLAQRADGDLTKYRREVEDWFDRQMTRVSGAYGRWSQVVMVVVGLAIAAGFNVSAYTVGRALWVDPSLRARVVAAAEQAASTTTTTTTAPLGAAATSPTSVPSAASTPATTTVSTTTTTVPTYEDLKSYGLPIGWNKTAFPNDLGDDILHGLGWLVVAIAASFGAPFWFDTLNKFVNLRTSGSPPATAAEQRAMTSTS